MEGDKANSGTWLKVFCPDARCLTPEEVVALPKDKQDAAQAAGGQGLWLEVFCPDGACLTPEEKPDKPTAPQAVQNSQGLWLNLFCPGGACVIEDEGKLP